VTAEGRHAQTFENRRNSAFRLLEKSLQEMERLQLLIAGTPRNILRALQRFLGLDGEFVKSSGHVGSFVLADFQNPAGFVLAPLAWFKI